MQKWKLVVGVTLIFVFGVLAGILAAGVYIKHRHPFFKGPPEHRRAFIMEKLSQRLDLTEVQKKRIEKIVGEMRAKTRIRFHEHRKERRALLTEGFSRIRMELTAEQQNKLDLLKKEFEKRRKKREERFFDRDLRRRPK